MAVHGPSACAKRNEALYEPCRHNETTASSPRPSPPVEEREKATAVHGRSAGSRTLELSINLWRCDLAQPFQGCGSSTPQSQGSSFLATLGFEAESLWDSRLQKVQGFKERKLLSGKSPQEGETYGQFLKRRRFMAPLAVWNLFDEPLQFERCCG